MIILCASLASQPVSESVREREISIEMKTEMETDGDKEADRARVKERESNETKLERADRAVSSSYQNRLFLMGQNAAIKEWRRGNTSLPVVFITLTQVPAILLAAAMHSASRRKQHHSAM